MTNKSETNIKGSEHLPVTNLLQLNQNRLSQVEDEEIGRLKSQLTEYEQELYEKDVYIKKLEDNLGQSLKTSQNKGIVL